ncbi:hypothetical protein REPUB_Repub07fG0181200 [Reevesia pubescens]
MAPLKLVFFLLFFLQSLTNGQICKDTCSDVWIDFPFRITDQPDCCGNPNFNLSCINRDQTTITFPFAGEFNVFVIGYASENIMLGDPENCIPKRLLQGLDLSGTPFEPRYPESYIFFNCSAKSNVSMGYAIRFSCLSGKNFSVWAIPTILYNQSSSLGSCLEIAKIFVPLSSPDWPEYFIDDILLTWEEPDCRSSCNSCGRNCQPGVDGECSNHFKKKSGLSNGTKYSLIFILGTPIFLILVCIIHYNVRSHCHDQHQQSNVEMPSLAAEPRLAASTVNGLDGPSIEAYPITLLGESYRLPRPNDNICSICLSEYKAKETIRTIPDCDHYFHANCIDEWLKLNAACPVCRSTPDQESALTTHSTLSS